MLAYGGEAAPCPDDVTIGINQHPPPSKRWPPTTTWPEDAVGHQRRVWPVAGARQRQGPLAALDRLVGPVPGTGRYRDGAIADHIAVRPITRRRCAATPGVTERLGGTGTQSGAKSVE